jgi:tripartite motif-containing protein 71
MASTYGASGAQGTGPGQLGNVAGIVVDRSNKNLYVLDSSNNRLETFAMSGKHVLEFGTLGKGNGEFDRPTGLTADTSSHRTYVVDNHNSRVQILLAPGSG